MGDRGNIEIKQHKNCDSVFLYTHWRGSYVNIALARAIKKSGHRCSDPSYFTRIALNELQGDDRSTSGFGICVGQPDDNEHPIPKVFWDPDNGLSINHPTVVNTLGTRTGEQWIEWVKETYPDADLEIRDDADWTSTLEEIDG